MTGIEFVMTRWFQGCERSDARCIKSSQNIGVECSCIVVRSERS
jgi:hypothetical protein